MLILLFLFCLGMFSFFVPASKLKAYFVFVSIIISAFLAFYTPPATDDLYRYYQLFDIAKRLSAKDFWGSHFRTSDWLYNYLLTDYMQNSKTFMVILFLLSRIGVKQFLPMFFSLLTYLPVSLLICRIGSDQKATKQAMCTCFVVALACIDYRFVTALRNFAAYVLFIYILYYDLIGKKNKILCFAGYIVLCELHMSCVVLLFIRLIVMILNRHLRIIVVAAMISAFMMSRLLADVLKTYFNKFPYLLRLAQRIVDYNIGRTNYNIHGALFFIGSLLVCLGIYYLNKGKHRLPRNTNKYSQCYIYTFAYTLGSIRQYDVLVRNCALIAIMSIPYIMTVANNLEIKGNKVTLRLGDGGSKTSDITSLVLMLGLVLFSFVFYTLFSYVPMQKGINFF